MAGKVIVSQKEWEERITAARLQCDIMGTDTMIVCRTDTYSGKFLDNNIDKRDHPFILGVVDPSNVTALKTFVEAGRDAISN